MQKVLLTIILCITVLRQVAAQNTMRIHNIDGNILEVPTEKVDSITFVEKDVGHIEASLVGEWFWGNQERGYYELLTFNEDKNYTSYDNYFTYGFDTMTYGAYSQYGTLLTLWSNGYGYQHRYTWFITGLTDNAFSVMTKMGPFTYYRLKPEIIHLSINESFVCDNGETFIFADSIVAQIVDGKLTGLSQGESYILKMTTSTQMIWAYKIVVE